MPKSLPTHRGGFREEAVNLLLSGCRPLRRIAAELGIPINSLSNWGIKLSARRRAARAVSAQPIRWRRSVPLQHEVDYLRRQREILKKRQ
jgi:transposase-like protein